MASKRMENAEPDEWPPLIPPTTDGRPVPERSDKDWAVGKITTNRVPDCIWMLRRRVCIRSFCDKAWESGHI